MLFSSPRIYKCVLISRLLHMYLISRLFHIYLSRGCFICTCFKVASYATVSRLLYNVRVLGLLHMYLSQGWFMYFKIVFRWNFLPWYAHYLRFPDLQGGSFCFKENIRSERQQQKKKCICIYFLSWVLDSRTGSKWCARMRETLNLRHAFYSGNVSAEATWFSLKTLSW